MSEPSDSWFKQVHRFLFSLHQHLNAGSRVHVACYFAGRSPRWLSAIRSEFPRVRFALVDRGHPENPSSNKVAALQAHTATSEVVLLCDCDTIVNCDLGAIISTTSSDFSAKPADLSVLNAVEWDRLASLLQTPLPSGSVRATASRSRMPPYFNTGVCMIRSSHLGELARAWMGITEVLLGLRDEQPDVLRSWRHVNQIAATFALSVSRSSWTELPAEWNVPTTLVTRVPVAGIKLLHYHDRYDRTGRLLRTHDRTLNAAIAAHNRVYISAERPALPRRGPRRAAGTRLKSTRIWERHRHVLGAFGTPT